MQWSNNYTRSEGAENGYLTQEIRIRKSGAGRKSSLDKIEGIDDAFLKVILDNTAGSPMDESIKWTNLSRSGIAEKLKEQGIDVSVTVVGKLLKKQIYALDRHLKPKQGKRIFHSVTNSLKILNGLSKNILKKGTLCWVWM